MDFLSKKVLITGVSGFSGRYFSEYFSALGFQVYGIGNTVDATDKNNFACDLREKEQLEKIIAEIQPSIVIHLAAISFVGHPNIEDFYSVNVVGTQNLLEGLKNHSKNIQKVILASSATVYGNQEEYELLAENWCPNPNNHYGISKLAMEQIAKTYFDILPIIITRPFNYTAPGQHINFVIPKITNAFKTKEAQIDLGNINVFREYNSIDFIAECYHKLAVSDYRSELVNLCSGETHSLQEVIDLCSKITGHQIKVEINPEFVRKNDIYKLSGDPGKLRSMIDLNERPNDLEKTLKSFL